MTTHVRNQDPRRLPATLASGAVLAPGETGDADLEAPHNAALLERGVIVATGEQPSAASAPTGDDAVQSTSAPTGDENTDAAAEPSTTPAPRSGRRSTPSREEDRSA